MEKLSRVKKYEDLRKSIEMDNNIDATVQDESLAASENLLKSFDSSVFKKVEIKEEEETPKRAKAFDDQAETNKENLNDTFTNEYLDDFIKEVRDYNIRKGNRESEDTEVDILYQLNAANRAKRTRYIQEIKDEVPEMVQESPKTVLSKEEIAQEVKNLLREDSIAEDVQETVAPPETTETMETLISDIQEEEALEIEETNDEAIPDVSQTQQIITEPVKKIITPVYEDVEEEDVQEIDDVQPDNTYHKKLIEETQQLRVRMDEYEEELTDLSDGVEKTNKLLNFVLCFLILVLLVVIGFIGYSIWKAGGFNL